jgi:hypothetical protein
MASLTLRVTMYSLTMSHFAKLYHYARWRMTPRIVIISAVIPGVRLSVGGT